MNKISSEGVIGKALNEFSDNQGFPKAKNKYWDKFAQENEGLENWKIPIRHASRNVAEFEF